MPLINNRIFDTTKKLPGLEIPKMTRGVIIFSYCLAVISIAYGFYIFTYGPNAEKFLYLALIPVILYLFRSPLAFLSFLITGVVITSFLIIGNPEDISKFIFFCFIAVFIFYDLHYSYLVGIATLYIFAIPSYQGFTITHATFFLLTLAFISTKIAHRDFPVFEKTGLNRILSLFYGWAVLSILWSPDLGTGMYDLVQYLILFSIFLLSVSLIDDQKQLTRIAWTWVIMAFLYSLVKPFYSPGMESGDMGGGGGVVGGIFSAKNTVSSLINLSLFMLVSLYATDKRLLRRLFLIFASGWMMAVNIIFGSKGGLISFGISFVLYLFFVNTKEKKLRRGLFRVFSIMVVVGLILIIPMVPLIFFPLGEIIPIDVAQTPYAVSLGFRFDQWSISSEMLKDNSNHLIGLGLGGFKALYSEYARIEFQEKKINIMTYAHPHCYWIFNYTDMGIIGMVLLNLFFILFVLRMRKFLLKVKSRRLKVFGTAVFFGVISYWIHGIADFGVDEANRLWLFIGTGLAITFMKDDEEEKEEPDEDESLSLNFTPQR